MKSILISMIKKNYPFIIFILIMVSVFLYFYDPKLNFAFLNEVYPITLINNYSNAITNLYTFILQFIGFITILFFIKYLVYIHCDFVSEKLDNEALRTPFSIQKVIYVISNFLVDINIIFYILNKLHIITYYFNYYEIDEYGLEGFFGTSFGYIGMSCTFLCYLIRLVGIFFLPYKQK